MIREAEAELKALWTLQVTSVLARGAKDERLGRMRWISWLERAPVLRRFLLNI